MFRRKVDESNVKKPVESFFDKVKTFYYVQKYASRHQKASSEFEKLAFALSDQGREIANKQKNKLKK